MTKIKIDEKELLVLIEFNDEKYSKIIMCLDDDDNTVFVIENKIVIDQNIIDELNETYGLDFKEENPNVIF